MKAIAYDWAGLNEWLYQGFRALHFSSLDPAWRVLSHGYGYVGAALVVLALCARYLMLLHTGRRPQGETLGEILATLVLSFSVVMCALVTIERLAPLPRPWYLYEEWMVVQAFPAWLDGFPSVNATVAVMFACLFWRHAGKGARRALLAYAAVGCSLSMVAGLHFPADIAAGALLGAASVWVARWYLRLTARIMQPA
ncbi:phosphatase PAP2 family protein [Orrella sp. JC864]|uniref:phosphatase PAP2 family protein n=1 Tax=Orrella sp. JC864 TaxID=3120298 RepID=UPI0012BBDA0C